MPAPASYATGAPLEAVRSVAGLRGFVGVDFVRDETTGETTVIEINPRPTTSYVGLARLCPAGAIAGAWLDLFLGRVPADDLRGMIGHGAGRDIGLLDPTARSASAGRGNPDGAASETWLALDVGGANIKAAHSSGRGPVAAVRALEAARRTSPEAIARVAVDAAAGRPGRPDDDRRALRLLPDQGASACSRSSTPSRAALPGRPVVVWGVDGRLTAGRRGPDRPDRAAAANWLALATVAARLVGPGSGLLIDVGSTTTDLIPLLDGTVAAPGPDRHRAAADRRAGLRRGPADARLRPRRPICRSGAGRPAWRPSCSPRPSTST